MNYFDPKYIERVNLKIVKRVIEVVLVILLLSYLVSFLKKDERVPIGCFVLTSEIAKEDLEDLLMRKEITLRKSDGIIKSISNFDVNEKGMVAVAVEGFKNSIAVYDSKGNYQYGYSFLDDGSFYTEWKGDDLWLYFSKSEIGLLLDRQANCKKGIYISDKKAKKSHWDELTYGKRKVGSDTYQVVRGKIVKTDKDGHKEVVYNAFMQRILLLIAFVMGIGFVIKLELDGNSECHLFSRQNSYF